jgi:thiamine biosynthesis lipoprotein
VVLWLLQAPSAHAELRRYEYSADAMGGTFSIAVYADSRPRADAATADAFAELRRLDGMLSNYRPDSQWSEVNRDAAGRAVRVPTELFELVSEALEYSRRSEGAFDITVGPLVKAWGFHGGTGQRPSEEVIREAMARVGYGHVVLDTARSTISFARAGVELDPGGIGKGYAVDRMVAILRRHGIDNALVSAARSSLYAMGAPPGQPGWPVVIGGPATGAREVRLVLADESLSTSGSTVKFFRADERTFGHVLDPRSGYPTGGVLAAVVAPRALDSEAWTKAVLVNGREWSAQHTPAGWRVLLCDGDRPSSCAWRH